MKTNPKSLALLFAVCGMSGMAAKAQTVVATDFFGGTLNLYSSTGTVLSTIAAPSPYGVTDDGSGDLFVAQTDSGTIGEYTTSGTTVSTSFITGLGPVRDVAYSNGILYSIDDNGTVDAFDAKTGSVIADSFVQIPSGSGSGIAVLGTTLFVSDPTNGTIGTYNAITGAVINGSFLSGLSSPRLLSISGDDLIVPLLSSNSVAEYNATTGALVATFSSGYSSPVGASLSGSDLFVANAGSGTITENGTTFASGGSLFTDVDAIAAAPEPADVSLLALGMFSLVGMMFWKRRMTV
jgi:PQQ-like domain